MQFDEYEVIRVLGQGAFAIVKLLRHRATNSLVAVKELTEESRRKPEYVGWFEREIKILTALKGHPNVIELLHSEVSAQRCIIAMPAAKQNLYEFIQYHNANIDLAYRVSLFDQILSAMVKAHTLNLLHRDLAPPNVLVFETNDTIVLKVADFGLGKRLDSGSMLTTASDNKYGQFNYTAPEVFDSLLIRASKAMCFRWGKCFNLF